jgi:hypothetical protein
MGLNEQFLQNPSQFAGLHALYPYADKVTNAEHMKDLSLNDGTEFTQVQGENKVAFCDILPATRFDNVPVDIGCSSYHEDQGLYVMRISYRRASSSSIPVYYLPWQTNYMMRMKLRPSPKHPTKERRRSLLKKTIEPDIFVTAALQGCSIFINGEPEEPVVYHINASGIQGPQGETLGTDDDTEYQTAAQAKVTHMTQLFQAATAQFPGAGARLRTGQRAPLSRQAARGAAHMADYMPDRLPSRVPQLRQRHEPQGVQHFSVEQFGTVFGRRKDGAWRFYRQTRTRIEYKEEGQWVFRWVRPVCVRFWP